MKIAVIDIGTNSIHMLMGEIHPNFTFEVIGREKEMTRLGDGTMAKKRLSPVVMNRGLETIKKFHRLAQSKGIQKIIAVATSAVREAENGGDLVRQVLQETSIRIRVITGEEEGRLIYLGVKHSMELPEGNTLIIDIGGGSIEVMVVNAERILFLKSLKLGAARLHQLFLKNHHKKRMKKLEKHIQKSLEEILVPIQTLGFSQTIGTSGTINNLATMSFFQSRRNSEESPPRDRTLKYEDLKTLYQTLMESTPESRAKMKGLDPLRQDLISSGAAVAYQLMKQLEIKSITFCDKAIREGMIYDYITRNRFRLKAEESIPDVRLRNALRLAAKCNYEKSHAEQIARLAMQIFDQTIQLHQLGITDRDLLKFSALLHDIGYHISFDRHHQHAFYLIKHSNMNGFSEEEIEILAHTARYHRRSTPKETHLDFQSLPKNNKKRISWLSAILRIADALDRSHFSVVEKVKVKINKKSVSFLLDAKNDAEYELWDVKQRCSFFQKLSKRVCQFKLKSQPPHLRKSSAKR